MVAHTTLWIDAKGVLVDGPPASGMKLPAGGEIPQHLAKRFELELVDGKIVQHGRAARAQAPSTPPPMIADRDLFLAPDGTLADTGVKIVSAGAEVAMHYISEYGLEQKDGKVVQKARKAPANKSIEDPPNKTGGLTLTDKRDGRRSSR